MNQNNISCYSLNISNKFADKQTIKKEMKNIYQLLKRIKKANKKFKSISFIIGISNVDSAHSRIEYIYSGKKGRPPKIILGIKKQWHIHIYVIDTVNSSSTFCQIAMMHLSNKKKYKTSKNKNDNVDNAINYLQKQCINVWTYGDYFKSKK